MTISAEARTWSWAEPGSPAMRAAWRYLPVAIFLLDRYCLGIKDAFAEIVPPSVYRDKFMHKMRSQFSSHAVTPAKARKLVEDSVAYAADLGFPPQGDYHKAKILFGDVNASECTEEFEFGKDGRIRKAYPKVNAAAHPEEVLKDL